MAVENQSNQNRDEQEGHSDESTPKSVFQWWKVVMAILAGVGGYLNAYVTTQSVGYAAGAAFGQAAIIAIALVVITSISRKYSWLQVESVRSNIYAAICVVSAIIGALGGLIGLQQGSFIFSYVVLYITAIIGETLFGVSKSPSTAN